MSDYYDLIVQARYEAGADRLHRQQLEQAQLVQARRAERQAQAGEQRAGIDAIRERRAAGESRTEVDRLRQSRTQRASQVAEQRQQTADAAVAERNEQGQRCVGSSTPTPTPEVMSPSPIGWLRVRSSTRRRKPAGRHVETCCKAALPRPTPRTDGLPPGSGDEQFPEGAGGVLQEHLVALPGLLVEEVSHTQRSNEGGGLVGSVVAGQL